MKKNFKVAVFGSARIHPNDPTYKLIFRLAKMIAREEMDVVTGGGPGLMDAASRGHFSGKKNNGTHSYGLTIKLPHEQAVSKHLDIKKDFEHFSDRLDNFMALSNAVVVAPGGIGTILEFFYTWQLTQVEHIDDIPIIFLGDQWKGLINWIKRSPLKANFLKKHDLDNLFFAKTASDVLKILRDHKKKFILNKSKHKYKINK